MLSSFEQKDILGLILSFLPYDLHLNTVCKLWNTTLSHHEFFQSLNRYFDEIAPKVTTQAESLRQRCLKKFNIVAQNQIKEIEHFDDIYRGGLEEFYCAWDEVEFPVFSKFFDDISKIENRPPPNLKTFLERHTLIEKINIEIISKKIEEAILKKSKTLVLRNSNLTRIPAILFKKDGPYVKYQSFWKSVEYIDCHDNDLNKLPEDLKICVSLKVLNCSKNKLTTLPTELAECPQLHNLICLDNQISEVSEELKKKFGQAWYKQLCPKSLAIVNVDSFKELGLKSLSEIINVDSLISQFKSMLSFTGINNFQPLCSYLPIEQSEIEETKGKKTRPSRN
ncbi:MAG: leucine-rich repeat domain-containing protein [Proteobacteria bacterium]|nr:leucine-rich repeat domain-containing protein [Pseudomonadota bacterium]